jgi:hypothetical protein
MIIILVPFDNSSVKEGPTKSPNKQERRGDTRKERLKPQISNNDESTGGATRFPTQYERRKDTKKERP